VEEQTRENGLFIYFIRNLIQIAVVGTAVFFLVKETVFFTKLIDLLETLLVKKAGFKAIKIKEYIPAITELCAWIWIIVLMTHAFGPTEFNRDGTRGLGMMNFGVFTFLLALTVGGLVAFPYLKIGTAVASMNKNLLIVAVVAFAGFLFDCIIRPRYREVSQEELDVEEYFAGEGRYNNTII
jgi:hypothetical protein